MHKSQGGFDANAEGCPLACGVDGRGRGVGHGGFRPGPGEEDQDRRDLRPDRPVRRRRVGAALSSAPRSCIDWFNAHGGVEGYKVEAVYADAQSKPDVAINEAVRLIEQEKVDMLLGFYSSAECVPAAARDRAVQEVHVDHHLHRLAGARGPATAIRVPPAAVRRRNGAWHRPRCSRPTRRRSSARTRRTCASPSSMRTAPMAPTWPRATTTGRQEVRLPGRAGRRLFGHRARPVLAGHQAEAGAAGRDLAYRLQSGHQLVPAPGARGRAAFERVSAMARAIPTTTSSRNAVGDDANYLLRRRSDLDLARPSQKAHGAGAAADHQDGRRRLS